MPEIVWKQGAENDLLQIFAELEDRLASLGLIFTPAALPLCSSDFLLSTFYFLLSPDFPLSPWERKTRSASEGRFPIPTFPVSPLPVGED